MQNVSDWALHAKGVAHIGLLKFELGIPFEMAEIFRCAGDEMSRPRTSHLPQANDRKDVDPRIPLLR